MSATVTIKELKAALNLASTDRARHVMCSVKIEKKPGEVPLLVATDGKILFAIQSESGDTGPGAFDFAIPSNFLKAVLTVAARMKVKQVKFSSTSIGEGELAKHRVNASVCAIEGSAEFICSEPITKFPRWRCVVDMLQLLQPDNSGRPVLLSQVLLNRIIEGLAALGVPASCGIKIHTAAPHDAFRISVCHHLQPLILLMPMREDSESSSRPIPDWAKTKVDPKPEKV